MKLDYGWAWIKGQQRVICSVREIKRGRNKNKVEIRLCRGRDANKAIIPGRKMIVPFDNIIELPSTVL